MAERSRQADYCEQRFIAALGRHDDRAATFWARMEWIYLQRDGVTRKVT